MRFTAPVIIIALLGLAVGSPTLAAVYEVGDDGAMVRLDVCTAVTNQAIGSSAVCR